MNAPAAQDAPTSFYEAHKKIYPREIGGRFQRLRNLAVWVLLGLYYLLPWIPWDGRQSVLFDLPARKFYVFGLVFWPQDFFYLTWLLIILGLSLFFFTALAGRLWCGYACPQTVWTDVFMSIERRIEGDRNRRLKLDRGPWTGEKILRKGSKHVAWLLLALWTGFTFVGFFTPIQELATKVIGLSMGPWETFWVLFYSLATWGNAGFMREQVCKYMCPYARFQSAMFDKDTLIISYDEQRGEPRGSRQRSVDHREAGLGDCIDCTLCVQVCPTGIDIRDGLQYDCIACAACIDACDSVMDRMGYPRGLVRYTTEQSMAGKKTRILRPRVFVYATLLLVLIGGLVTSMVTRTPVILDVIRDRNSLYRELPDGMIENIYTLKLINQSNEPRSFRLSVAGVPGLILDGVGDTVDVPGGEILSLPVRTRANRDQAHGIMDITFTVEATDDASITVIEDSRFVGLMP